MLINKNSFCHSLFRFVITIAPWRGEKERFFFISAIIIPVPRKGGSKFLGFLNGAMNNSACGIMAHQSTFAIMHACISDLPTATFALYVNASAATHFLPRSSVDIIARKIGDGLERCEILLFEKVE